MNAHNIEFFNIEALERLGWPEGANRLQRVPEALRLQLNEGAQSMSLCAANAELRFVCEGPFRLHLRTPNGENRFHIAYGGFVGRAYAIADMKVQIERPKNLKNLDPTKACKHVFSPDVVRVLLPNAEVQFMGIEAEGLRPPHENEVPQVRLLACGTSITQGACATVPHLSYVSVASRELGADVLNLGMSGSFHAEPELADYVASRDDWDVATIEISVNMVSCFTVDEFRGRVRYFINTVAQAHPGKPVVCITLFPYFNDLCHVDAADADKTKQFRSVLREELKQSDCKNLYLIEGNDILDTIEGLSEDLIHPNDFGMIRMGQNLAGFLRPLVHEYRASNIF